MTPPLPVRWDVAGFFIIRTPYLPIEDLLALSHELEAAGGCADGLAADRDRRRVTDRLVEISRRPDVREALRLASPTLDHKLETWQDDPVGHAADKVTRSVLRYVTRMTSRATPFGLFAGWSMGTTGGATTRLDLPPRGRYRRRTGIDCEYLNEIGRALEREPAVRERMTLTPNSTLHEAAGRVRYVESSGTAHHLVVAEPEPVLSRVLESATGGRRRAELAEVVRQTDDTIAQEDALAFVDELIDQQVLVSNLALTMTGGDPLDEMIHEVEGMGADAVAATLRKAQRILTEVDAEPPGVHPGWEGELAAVLTGLSNAPDPRHLLRTDLVKPADVSLGSVIVGDLVQGMDLLRRIGGTPAADHLRDFRSAFLDRYGDRAVPLCEVLDEECGLGFPPGRGTHGGFARAAPVFDGLTVRRPEAGTAAPFGRRDEVLSRLFWHAARDAASEIELGPSEIAELEAAQGEAPELADAVAVMATVIAGTPEDVAAGRYRLHLAGVSGPSGANLLGRFCADDDGLTEHVRAYLQGEEALHPDAAFAEVVHLPNPRSGNVVARPPLRGYEIPYLARSGAPRERQIPVNDLSVSVVQGRLVLTSTRLGREIVARLTCAHDYRGPRNLALYRFLGALQNQDTATALTFKPGALAGIPHLPRITSGRLILSRARWNLTPAELRPLLTVADSGRLDAAHALRAGRSLPRWVALVDGGSLLPIDLENALFVDVAAGLLRRRPGGATFVELFHGHDELPAKAPEGRFTHELVVPFLRAAPQTVRRVPHAATLAPSRQEARRFAPGSEWLYAKLYTGSLGDEVVLREVVRPTVAYALGTAGADRWFFVRYGDPDWHIRLRIHGDSAKLVSDVLPALLTNASTHLASGRIWRVQVDTYEREVNRYGGPDGIGLAERVFHADSEATLDLLTRSHGDSGSGERWRLALVGADHLMADAGMDLAARHALASAARESYRTEFEGDGALGRRLGATYRKERSELERLLDSATSVDPAFAMRGAAVRPIFAELRACVDGERFGSIVGSFLHMQANRLLGSDARRQELVVYDFLTRIYESRLARGRT